MQWEKGKQTSSVWWKKVSSSGIPAWSLGGIFCYYLKREIFAWTRGIKYYRVSEFLTSHIVSVTPLLCQSLHGRGGLRTLSSVPQFPVTATRRRVFFKVSKPLVFFGSTGRDFSKSDFTLSGVHFRFDYNDGWFWKSAAKSGLTWVSRNSCSIYGHRRWSDKTQASFSVTVFSRITCDNSALNCYSSTVSAAILQYCNIHLNELLIQNPSSWLCSYQQWGVFGIKYIFCGFLWFKNNFEAKLCMNCAVWCISVQAWAALFI